MAATQAPTADERIVETTLMKRLMARPELGAVAGTILVFLFFAIVAGNSGLFSAPGIINFLEVSAQLGIIAVAASMLMIGGEFDLSIGSMIGAAGVIIAIPAAQWGWPLWLCILLAFAIACAIGYVNGLIVIRSGLPSFIVTLAGLFILRGLTIGFTRLITGRTQVSGIKDLAADDWLAPSSPARSGSRSWSARQHRADRHPRRRRARGLRDSDVDRLVDGPDRGRHLHPAAHPGRQLDLRLRRRSQRRPQRRRAGGGGQDQPVHVHRLRRHPVRLRPGARRRLGRHQPRPAQGVRGDHRRGDRRLPADRRLRLGDRRQPSAP